MSTDRGCQASRAEGGQWRQPRPPEAGGAWRRETRAGGRGGRGISHLSASGRAREEDDAVGVARDLVECLDHLSLAAAAVARERHGRPHALVELLAERLDQALLLGGHV